MESKQKTLYMSRQLIEFNHIYKEFNDVYREAAAMVGLSLSGFDILYALCEMGDWLPPLILACFSPPIEVGVISHLILLLDMCDCFCKLFLSA